MENRLADQCPSITTKVHKVERVFPVVQVPHGKYMRPIDSRRVEIGDEFHYRMELHILGLHRPPQGGIDCMYDGRRNICVSIVASGGYDNYISNQETLIYSGQGGKAYGNGGKGLVDDQNLERGNLALSNSIKMKNHVRVIRGSKVGYNSTNYFYDGLYTVEKM
ncbi:hypothetical protein ACH5RR_040418 [Cinchona calisaya]|uniref:YDG domain-containing protein n=1 Tax=Cinchona calisaya TaxID=153742 RepID=A0ABD2XSY1_9GENT